jgi:hypothetical protein
MTLLLLVALLGTHPAPAGYPTSMPATVFTAPIGHYQGVRS